MKRKAEHIQYTEKRPVRSLRPTFCDIGIVCKDGGQTEIAPGALCADLLISKMSVTLSRWTGNLLFVKDEDPHILYKWNIFTGSVAPWFELPCAIVSTISTDNPCIVYALDVLLRVWRCDVGIKTAEQVYDLAQNTYMRLKFASDTRLVHATVDGAILVKSRTCVYLLDKRNGNCAKAVFRAEFKVTRAEMIPGTCVLFASWFVFSSATSIYCTNGKVFATEDPLDNINALRHRTEPLVCMVNSTGNLLFRYVGSRYISPGPSGIAFVHHLGDSKILCTKKGDASSAAYFWDVVANGNIESIGSSIDVRMPVITVDKSSVLFFNAEGRVVLFDHHKNSFVEFGQEKGISNVMSIGLNN